MKYILGLDLGTSSIKTVLFDQNGREIEDLLGRGRDHLQHGGAPLAGGGHVEEGDLVRALRVVAPGQLDGE